MVKNPRCLHDKMVEINNLISEDLQQLHDAYNIIITNKKHNIPVDASLYRTLYGISTDILDFLDYADYASQQSTALRCIIQDYLEILNKKDIHGQ